jgi:hypothetical protein
MEDGRPAVGCSRGLLRTVKLAPVTIAAALATAVSGTASSTQARPACWKRLLNEWYSGQITTIYPHACYVQAIEHIPADLRISASFIGDLRAAEKAAAAGKPAPPEKPLPQPRISMPSTRSKATRRKPPWVSAGVALLRSYFRGSPIPAAIDWRETAARRSVTITFERPQVCVKCGGGHAVRNRQRARIRTGREATVSWLRRDLRPGRGGTSIAIK